MTLIERLMRLGALWAEACNRSTARLATIVANDGKLFERLEAGKTCTVDTLERFLAFLGTPSNWPAATGIPAEAASLLASVKLDAVDHLDRDTGAVEATESGNGGEISARVAA